MAVPPLIIDVEPVTAAGRAYWLPVAAKSSGHPALCKLVLRLKLTNAHASDTLTVTSIEFTFPSSSHPPKPMFGVAQALSAGIDPDPNDGKIPPGVTATWSNGVVDGNRNEVYVELPAPRKVKIWLRCSGYADPRTHTMDLVPYTDPTGRGPFILPFGPNDLGGGEYVVTGAEHWSNGGAEGTQIFAHDITVQAKSGGKWTKLKHGRKGDTNDDHRIYGMPVRAMADGIVRSSKNDHPENPRPGEKLDVKPLTGNHVWVEHGQVKVKYAHFQPGTIPADLLVNGTAVRAGQMLGRAGNSGNSDAPHLHIECHAVSNDSLRGMPFTSGWVVARSLIAADQSGPWVRLSGQGISRDTVAIWPASTAPRTIVPMAGIARSGDWGNTYWVSENGNTFAAQVKDLDSKQGMRLVHAATYLERGHRRWMGIARTGDWSNTVWSSNDRASFELEAQRVFDRQGRRLVFVTTYREGSARRWFGIARSGEWDSSFWISGSRSAFEATAQDLFVKRGLRLIHVTSYPVGSARHWVGIARSGDWGNAFIAGDDQAGFGRIVQDQLDKHGRRLNHVHSYVEGGKRRWVGIARSGDWALHFLIYSDLDGFNRQTQWLFDQQGCRLTQAVPLSDGD